MNVNLTCEKTMTGYRMENQELGLFYSVVKLPTKWQAVTSTGPIGTEVWRLDDAKAQVQAHANQKAMEAELTRLRGALHDQLLLNDQLKKELQELRKDVNAMTVIYGNENYGTRYRVLPVEAEVAAAIRESVEDALSKTFGDGHQTHRLQDGSSKYEGSWEQIITLREEIPGIDELYVRFEYYEDGGICNVRIWSARRVSNQR